MNYETIALRLLRTGNKRLTRLMRSLIRFHGQLTETLVWAGRVDGYTSADVVVKIPKDVNGKSRKEAFLEDLGRGFEVLPHVNPTPQ